MFPETQPEPTFATPPAQSYWTVPIRKAPSNCPVWDPAAPLGTSGVTERPPLAFSSLGLLRISLVFYISVVLRRWSLGPQTPPHTPHLLLTTSSTPQTEGSGDAPIPQHSLKPRFRGASSALLEPVQSSHLCFVPMMADLGCQPHTPRRRNLNWRRSSMGLTCGHACRAFCWLLTDVGGSSPS